MATLTYPATITGGTVEDVSQLNANLTAIQNVVNSIDDANISATAGIQQSKLASGVTGMAIGSFSAYAAVATSVAAANVDTKVTFGTEDWDVSGWFDSTTNHRFTPLVAGYYRLSAGVLFAGSIGAGNSYGLRLFKNGALHKILDQDLAASAFAGYQVHGTAIVLANGTTDFFEVFARQSTAAAVATDASAGGPATYFQGELIGRS